MVYFLQQESIIIVQNINMVKMFEKINPPIPELPRKNLTTITLLKLIISVLLLNLSPANTAQKTHTQTSVIIKLTKSL
jgi:hypothetical protein